MNIALDIQRIKRELTQYRRDIYKRVGAVGLRYIDDNFRAQGYQAKTLIPWRATKKKTNTFGKGNKVHVNAAGKTIRTGHALILVGTGRLRRSFRSNSPGPGLVRWFTDVPYARAHNMGFKGTVNVKSHTRRAIGKQKIYNINTRRGRMQKVETGTTTVKAHTMHMNIPRRQFIPTTDRPSEIFTKQIWGKINSDIKSIFNHHP